MDGKLLAMARQEKEDLRRRAVQTDRVPLGHRQKAGAVQFQFRFVHGRRPSLWRVIGGA